VGGPVVLPLWCELSRPRQMSGGNAALAGQVPENITRDIQGEVRIVERAFGLGAPVLAETVQFVCEQLELEAA